MLQVTIVAIKLRRQIVHMRCIKFYFEEYCRGKIMRKRKLLILMIAFVIVLIVLLFAVSNLDSEIKETPVPEPNETIIRIKEPEVWPEVKIIHPGEEGYTYP